LTEKELFDRIMDEATNVIKELAAIRLAQESEKHG
jgi:hypothetical protein